MADLSEKENFAPREGQRNILITSALPYVNNVPHLGNLIGCVLSADVFSRYCRLRGYNSLYICGTDEYGTATETKALKENTTPQAICDKYHAIHKQVYDWFNVDFDFFGRTTTEKQTEIAQDIFLKVYRNKYTAEQEQDQLYCEHDKKWLADRFVEGVCPKCNAPDARGDQCDACGQLYNAVELKSPKCKLCNNTPAVKTTRHLFLALPLLQEKLRSWTASANATWSSNGVDITNSWLKKDLENRAITRDLKWGTPVPHPHELPHLEQFKDKVFYVWFDAPIGYISITANYTPHWQKWWKNPKNVELVQFMGKDNVPFHTVIFPGSLFATGENWTTLTTLSTTDYLNYEGGKFSKTNGTGVFGDQASSTGIPSDTWRYYLLSIRPETGDSEFSWDKLQAANNSELADTVGNFCARGLKFAASSFDNKVPVLGALTPKETSLVTEVNKLLKEYEAHLEKNEQREGLRTWMAIGRLGNQYLQESKPWELVKTDRERCGTVIATAVSFVKLLAVLGWPYIPATSEKILREQLNVLAKDARPAWIGEFTLDLVPSGHVLGDTSQILFKKIENATITDLRRKFRGSQAEEKPFPLELRVGQVTGVEDHPAAEKLYILKVNLGASLPSRTVVAGLKSSFTKEQLLNKQLVLACNLKPAKFQGVPSEGMVVAANKKDVLALLGVAGGATLENGTLLKVDNHFNPSEKTSKVDGKKVRGLPFTINASNQVFFDDNKITVPGSKNVIVVVSAESFEGAKIQ